MIIIIIIITIMCVLSLLHITRMTSHSTSPPLSLSCNLKMIRETVSTSFVINWDFGPYPKQHCPS